MVFWRNGSEWLTLGLVVAGLLAAEVTMRGIRGSLSLDIQHVDQADEIVEDLVESEGLRVLVAGNSLLRSGVDGERLGDALSGEMDEPVAVGMVYPDGSNPVEWSFLHRKLVTNPHRYPDVVVLAFGPGHLRDRPVEQTLLRLAAHHVDRADVWSFLKNDLNDIESRSEFILARISAAYALRDRIAPRVMTAIIPYYQELSPILLQAPGPKETPTSEENSGQGGRESGGESGTAQAPSFSFLSRLLADYERAGIPVVALPMPAPENYEVDAGALDLFSRHGIPVLTVSFETPLGPERFPDGEHLDEEGMEAFTSALAPALAAELRRVTGTESLP
jgi:hypothetical protein